MLSLAKSRITLYPLASFDQISAETLSKQKTALNLRFSQSIQVDSETQNPLLEPLAVC
jgi:hypothetical protein